MNLLKTSGEGAGILPHDPTGLRAGHNRVGSSIRQGLLFLLLIFGSSLLQSQENPFVKRTMISSGRERVFHIYVPESLDQETATPLLFTFHGAGGNGSGAMKAFRNLADKNGFLLIGPDGINKRWNAGCDDEIKATNGADDVAFVRDMVQAVGDEFRIDFSRIYAWGFSNGAALQHRLAVETPETFAAMSAAGAAMAKNTAESRKSGPAVSIQIMVGGDDPMFGHKGNLRGGTFHTATETAEIWSRRNQCGEAVKVDTPVPFIRWPSRDAGAPGEVELWIVDGGGHNPRLSDSFDTPQQAWNFLSRQKRAPGEQSSRRVLSDIPYKSGPELDEYEKARCKLDVYVPEKIGKHPVLVWFHGGGLKGGDKQGTPNDGVKPKLMAESLAEAGVIVVCPNYRFSPKVQFPAYLTDAAASVSWARENLGKFGATPDQIYVGGHSAGGWIAFMLGLDPRYLEQVKLNPNNIAGFIPVSGQTMTHSSVRAEMGLSRYHIVADEAAPVFHMRKETAPFLVIYAENDMAGRVDENEYLVAMMKTAGNKRIIGVKVPDRNHGSIASSIAIPGDPARDAILTFMKVHKD